MSMDDGVWSMSENLLVGGCWCVETIETEAVALFVDHLGEDRRRQRCEVDAEAGMGGTQGLGWRRGTPGARGRRQVRPDYCSVVNASSS
jgi:hypothetical protein